MKRLSRRSSPHSLLTDSRSLRFIAFNRRSARRLISVST
jgi:hypothetical protein